MLAATAAVPASNDAGDSNGGDECGSAGGGFHEGDGTPEHPNGGPDQGKRLASDPSVAAAVRECGGVRLLLVEDDPTDLGAVGRRFAARGIRGRCWLRPGHRRSQRRRSTWCSSIWGSPTSKVGSCARSCGLSAAVPIIVVTARSDEIDRVVLLELGADDYVVKPFGFRELVARIRAVLRRTSTLVPGRARSASLEVGDLVIDLRGRTVEFDSETVALTPKEYDLLVCLASDAGAVKTREQLMREVWDEHWWGSTKTLDVHVASLRRKLSADVIETVRSVGYRYVDATRRLSGRDEAAAAQLPHDHVDRACCCWRSRSGCSIPSASRNASSRPSSTTRA